MSKFTPGPWQVSGSHIYTADPERAMLAQVFNPGSKASDFPLVENARLIAAAPELLEALDRINQWCCYATEEDTAARLMALQQIGVHARNAIAKATGA